MTIVVNPETIDKINLVAEKLIGTCDNLDSRIAEVFGEGIGAEDMAIELLELLDDVTMECERCGWWCEAGEMNDDQHCCDCSEEGI